MVVALPSFIFTSALTITHPPRDQQTLEINTPLNLSWTYHSAYDPEYVNIQISYGRQSLPGFDTIWVKTIKVHASDQSSSLEYNLKTPETEWEDKYGTDYIFWLVHPSGRPIYDWVGPLSLTEGYSLKNNIRKLLPRHNLMNEGWRGWNDWANQAPSNSVSPTTTTTVTVPPSSMTASSYSSTTTKTVTLELSTSN